MASPPHIARENGKKGGRPKGFAALEAERVRNLIAKKLVKHHAPIIARAIDAAKKGDRYAREWLYERAYGKAPQALTGEGGGPVEITITKYADKLTVPV
jgi:hypothetical protein